jgi:transposase
MKTKTDKLNKKIELLQRKDDDQGLTVSEKDSLIELQQARLAFLEEQFRLAKHKLFASENEAYPGQGNLFNEAEEIVELEQDKSEPPKDKLKRKRNTKPFCEHITREVVIHYINVADKVYACCQGELHCIGKNVTEKLVFVPVTTKAVEHHRLKYACRGCEQNVTRNTIK